MTRIVFSVSLCNSTPVQVLRAQVRLSPLPAPVWRSSAPLRSSSATVEAPAIITATRTASGWPLWTWMKCSGKISFSKVQQQFLKNIHGDILEKLDFSFFAQTESQSQRHWKLETWRPVWAAVLCVWRGRNVMTFVQSVVFEDQPSPTTTAAIMLITSVFHWCSIFTFNSMVLLCDTAKETEQNEFISLFFFFQRSTSKEKYRSSKVPWQLWHKVH